MGDLLADGPFLAPESILKLDQFGLSRLPASKKSVASANWCPTTLFDCYRSQRRGSSGFESLRDG
jgi:hypothetical protein